MGKSWDKFTLLMWKNWLLQYRRPVQTIMEIITPVVFCIILVLIRSLSVPKPRDTVIYQPFSTTPGLNASSSSIFPSADAKKIYDLVYSPRNQQFDTVMEFFTLSFKNIIGLNNTEELESYFVTHSANFTLAAVDFGDAYQNINKLSDIKNMKVSIRFPAETRYKIDPLGQENWKTNLIYPIFQTPGPRMYAYPAGADPCYRDEGFLGIQYFLTMSLLLARKGFTYKDTISSRTEILKWITNENIPLINMRRFPHSAWSADPLLQVLKQVIGLMIMMSFVYTSTNTIKSITTEKEKQLKESMKIMGLPTWLHWMAWFVKCFLFLFISAIIIVVLLKVRWYSNTTNTVFTNSDPLVMLLFMVFYIVSIITFCFAISVFFSKANTAATIAGLLWFLSFAPYLFMENSYDTLSLSSKLLSCLAHNTAMAFGFQLMIMYEGSGEGVQWNNIFTSNSPDDTLTLGLIMMMMAIDSVIYLLLTLYIEAVMPGEYGIALPWYFPFTSSFWCGQENTGVEDETDEYPTVEGEFFEPEPKNLKAGIQIKNLRKVFGNKVAVRNFSLNMYEDQITVLLGHNGAGKTTTMSMLTGMITPSSGTGRINGCDIRTNIEGVRSSLGLCPQHNIIFDDLTVAEHLYFFSKLKGLSKSDTKHEIDKYVSLLKLEDKRNAKSSKLSGGMKRKLCVGMALCGNSRVIMLDEPTAGMDPSARRALWNLLQTQKENRTMLLTTHFMDEADLLGDRIAIMAVGELQCCGSSFFLKKKYGAGYNLIMDKTQNCDAGKVTQLLRKYIPDIQVHSNIGSELTYLLVGNQSAIFEPMLKELEKESNRLGILGYGISLTTLEEVFMKVGADHGQEEMYDDGLQHENGHTETDNTVQTNNNSVNVSLSPYYTSGLGLVLNQFRAMFMKKFVSMIRSWIMLCIQFALPTIFLIIALVVARNRNRSGHLPAMPLNLQKFINPITQVQNGTVNDYGYSDVLNDLGYSFKLESNITKSMLELTKSTPNTVRRRYIVGASFEETPSPVLGPTSKTITAWFNNDPYHSPGITLALVLDSIYRKLLHAIDGSTDNSIEYINHPLPYSAKSQLEKLMSDQNMGFQLGFNVGFSMSFVSSFYVLFIVKEIMCGSKHLQFVSGVKAYVFWISHVLCDLLTYLATIALVLITLVCFQEDGFTSAAEIGRMFFLLVIFAWAFLPMTYIAGYCFIDPATGYSRMTLFNIFTGNAAFIVVEVLVNPTLDLGHVGRAIHWVFLVIPHYSLSNAISESYTLYSYNKICNTIFESCGNIPKEYCLAMVNSSSQITSICTDLDDNFFKWESPGIGRNVLYSILTGLLFFIILFNIEYRIFSRIAYHIQQKYFPSNPLEFPNEDSDVAAEKDKIRNATDKDISSTYQLAIRDLTKYYKKFLAVNGLSLGVKEYECFGLLGVNGAGKTTTFKMMTGDVKISHGDGWVNGKSIKTQLKKIQKSIGYCPQFDALLDNMTAHETIVMFSLLRGIKLVDARKVAQYLAEEFDFQRHSKKKVKELSGGNKRKLSTAVSLIGDPPVLFLDEPTTGMDPATKRYLWNALCKIRDNGKCIILTSHSMEECEALCTRLAIMVNGNFQCLGSTQHLKNKFAEGSTLTIKMKKLPESSGLQHAETGPVEKFISENFPKAQIRERHQELLNYYITDKSIPWSKMFGILERAKRSNLNIEDYSLGQSSLEQVFLTFTRQQTETSG